MKMLSDEKIEKLFAAYEKLKPFLARVPAAHWNGQVLPADPYAPVLNDNRFARPYRENRLLRMDPEDEYPYRTDSIYAGSYVIVWEPNKAEYPRPSWEEFFKAYVK